MSVVNALSARYLPLQEAAVNDDDRAWVEAELKDVGDQALMRGLVTAFPIMRPGLFLSYCGSRSEAGHKADDGYSPAVVPPPPMREVQVRCGDLRSDRLRLPCNGPHEATQLAGNGGTNHRRSLSSSGQRSIPRSQPALSLPCYLPHFGGACSIRYSFLAPTFGGWRYVQALSTSMCRTRPLPALVIEPRLTVSPVDRSPGTRPR